MGKLFGKGIFYLGEYDGTTDGKQTKCYQTWYGMLERCYSDKYILKFPTYYGCYVCEEWLHYQAFAEWYSCNYYEIDNERVTLDKDLLIKGNKMYSPKTCVFIPEILNIFIMQIYREYATGEFRGVNPHWNRYRARGSYDGKRIHLGVFGTKEEARTAHNKCKIREINRIINKYRAVVKEDVIAVLFNLIETIEKVK